METNWLLSRDVDNWKLLIIPGCLVTEHSFPSYDWSPLYPPPSAVPMEGPSFWRKAWGTIFSNFWSALWGGPKCFTFQAVKGRIDTEHGPRRSRNCKSGTANPETEEKASKHSRHCSCFLPVKEVWKIFIWWWWIFWLHNSDKEVEKERLCVQFYFK